MFLPHPANFALAAMFFINAYLTHLCSTDPSPPPTNPYLKDRLKFVAYKGHHPIFRLHFFLPPLLGFLHAFIVLWYPNPPPLICPHPENLEAGIFTWNIATVLAIGVTTLGARMRILAFRQLGENFTFRLARPNQLVKDGMYKYMQHPSYTALLLVLIPQVFLFVRMDGTIGCLLPPRIMELGICVDLLVYIATPLLLIQILVRVLDEEEMLRKEFGREWEEYHKKTKRFIPGIFWNHYCVKLEE